MPIGVFSCACSLRSTQCAALIALAAAAGISRFESRAAPAHPVETPTRTAPAVAPAPASEIVAAFARGLKAAEFARSGGAVDAPRLSTRAGGEVDGAEIPPAIPDGPRSVVPFAGAELAPGRAPAQNRLPYAVGPPRCVMASNLRVVGTVVPGDWAARRSESASPIAPGKFASRLWRPSCPSWNTAGPNSSPSRVPRDALPLFPS
jgi:hypothetical protein